MTQAQVLSVPAVSLIEGRPATTSIAIAEHFGKRHDHVCRDIRRICAETPEKFHVPNFGEMSRTVKIGNGAERQELYFTVFFDGFILLVMGYTGKKALAMKLAYIEAFNAMRDELERRKEPFENPDQSPSSLISVTPSSIADRKPLRSLINAWARVSGQPFDACWNQLKAAFRLTDIRDLPQEWIPDAIAWVQAKIDAVPKALPTAQSILEPAPAFRTEFPADMHTGRKDALKKIQSLMAGVGAARDVVRLFCHPGGKSMHMTLDEKEIYDALYQLYCAADDSLLAAYRALDAGYKIGRQYGRG